MKLRRLRQPPADPAGVTWGCGLGAAPAARDEGVCQDVAKPT